MSRFRLQSLKPLIRCVTVIQGQINVRTLRRGLKSKHLIQLFLFLKKRVRLSGINNKSKKKIMNQIDQIIHFIQSFRRNPSHPIIRRMRCRMVQLKSQLKSNLDTSSGTNAYILNQNANVVSVLNTVTDNQIIKFNSQSQPVYAAIASPNLDKVYIANQGTSNPGKVTEYTVSTNTATTITVGNNPVWVSSSQDGKSIYTANRGSNNITRIPIGGSDTRRNVAVGRTPSSLALSQVNQIPKLYVANSGDSTVSVLNASTLDHLGTITVGSNPIQVASSPDGTKVYTANRSENTVSIISTDNDSPISVPKLNVGGRPLFIRFDSNKSNPRAYISTSSNDRLVVINVNQSKVIKTITLSGNNPTVSTISPDNQTLYVVQQNPKLVSVIDTQTLKVVKQIKFSDPPTYAEIVPDGSKVYVTLINSNRVATILTSNNSLSTTTDVFSNPRFIVTQPVSVPSTTSS
ncbi:YncE family protein [Hazenella sp. IB182357]|uniref:YncE family protein n=1 Tax=Polycladospora coralii TaxID=2771432 RepID=A0A926RUQ0_9BACL|nr:YncE family protein [Polycladospora coralii]MBD1372644.1 YncE family protein [Polycladospora coralii]MBS7531248.1 YncE family protein [Polycladospora coralii]